MCINFLKETMDYMDEIHEEPEDVEFVGSRDRAISIGGWNEFKALADFMYNNNYGSTEVVTDIIITFKDGSVMFRDTYDGSEWWSFISGATHRKGNSSVTLSNPHLKNIGYMDSLKDAYRDQLEKEANADIDKKMKELDES